MRRWLPSLPGPRASVLWRHYVRSSWNQSSLKESALSMWPSVKFQFPSFCSTSRQIPHELLCPLTQYEMLVASGQYQCDPQQISALEVLRNTRHNVLHQWNAPEVVAEEAVALDGDGEGPTAKLPRVRGVYLYGGVGVGKTFVMDLFVKSLPSEMVKRTHFNPFMTEIFKGMHRFEQAKVDPIPLVAKYVMQDATVLCFDEFQVKDVAEALLIRRVLQLLFEAGTTVVATSNRHPKNLYSDGLNRHLFLPFISVLEDNCTFHGMEADYRKLFAKASTNNDDDLPSIYPSSPERDLQILQALTGDDPDGGDTSVDIGLGRRIQLTAHNGKGCIVTFNELCEKPMSSRDYLVIAEMFPVVILTGVPAMDLRKRNEARRFITLLDILYEAGTTVYFSGVEETPLAELFSTANVRAVGIGSGLEVEVPMYTRGDDPLSIPRTWNPEATIEQSGPAEQDKDTEAEGERTTLNVSAAEIGGVKDVVFAMNRAISRICEMQTLAQRKVKG